MLAVAALFAGTPRTASAAGLLNLNQFLNPMGPLVAANAIAADYVAQGFDAAGNPDGSGTFGLLTAASGLFATQFLSDPVGTPTQAGVGVFELSAVIDHSGPDPVIVTASLTVGRDSDFAQPFDDTLLFESSALASVGHTDSFGFGAEDKFEFLFENSAASLFPIAVVLDGRQIAGTSIVDFAASFSNDGGGKADIFLVPQPMAVWSGLALVGMLLIGRVRKVAGTR